MAAADVTQTYTRRRVLRNELIGLYGVVAHGVTVELGPIGRRGAGGEGTSVYFRDPDGTLLELIAYP